MTHIIIIAPVNLLEAVDGKRRLSLGPALGYDGYLTVPIYTDGGETVTHTVTHYACSIVGQQDVATFVSILRGLYGGTIPPPPVGMDLPDLHALLDSVTVSLDGEVLGRAGSHFLAGAPLHGLPHFEAVLSHRGLSRHGPESLEDLPE